MKEDLISKLIETFKEETQKISNSIEGVVNFKYEEFFKRNNPEKGYHSIDALIIFKKFTLKLEYKINVGMLVPKSTIEMRFMFDNAKLPVEYSIYDLLDIIEESNFKSYTFPYLTNVSKMIEVLNYLTNEFLVYKDSIEELSESIDKIQILEKNIEQKTQMLLNEKIFESRDAYYLMHMLELYYALDLTRFTTDAYFEYTKGNYKKAIKKYKKLKGKLTAYELRLVKYMKEVKQAKATEVNLNTLAMAKKYKGVKYEFIPMVILWSLLTPIWCIIYEGILLIALYLLYNDAIFVGGVQHFMLFMPAFITAIINSFFLRKWAYKAIFKKEYKELIELDQVENTPKIQYIMSKLFQFIIALGLVFSILLANTNISFYEGYFKDNLELLHLKGEMLEYTDVECVYRAEGFINGFEKIVNYPTYIILIKEGHQIDLSYYMDYVEIEKHIIPIFEKNNIDIRKIDLVENIQKDVEKTHISQEK